MFKYLIGLFIIGCTRAMEPYIAAVVHKYIEDERRRLEDSKELIIAEEKDAEAELMVNNMHIKMMHAWAEINDADC